MPTFTKANEEFQPLLRQIFENNPFPEFINVEPEMIEVIRSDTKSLKKTAYIKPIKGEYALLTRKKYFMVINTFAFDAHELEEQKWIILHEYCHPHKDSEEEYITTDHDVKDFSFLLKNTDWKLGLVHSYKFINLNHEKATPKAAVLE